MTYGDFMKKILMIFTCLFICLVCIAGAFAGDVDDRDILAKDNGYLIEASQYDSSIDLASDETDILANNPEDSEVLTDSPGSFYDLNQIINGDNNKEITLDRDYKYNADSDSEYKDGIIINRTVTINGNGHTIDGSNSARIFNLTTPSIVLNNIIFTNGKALYGGAIHYYYSYPQSTPTIYNCTFINNSANYTGGAIYAHTDVLQFYGLSVINSTFINNSADNGGAVSSCSNTNCTFINNSANYGGGALISCSADNCIFINNSASSGGAVKNDPWNYMDNCTFINNSATKFGGAVLGRIVTNCTFINNSAEEGGAGNGIIATNCTFINNSADNGGAIADSGATNCIFINNSATNFGGAVYRDGYTVNNCTFINNTANYGGATYNGSSTNCTFINNSANYTGGAAYGGSATNCIFINNSAQEGADTYGVEIKYIYETVISANNIVAVYKNNKYLTVTLRDENSNPIANSKITISVNGVSKSLTTNSNGQAKFNTNKLVPKTYTAKIMFSGTDDYYASSKNVKIQVKKAQPKITVKKKTAKVKTKVKKFTFVLKNHMKQPIKKVKLSLRVNKKTYYAKTNNKGKVVFKVKKLTKKGKYKAVIKFKGNKYYKKTKRTVKLVVK